MMAGKDKQRWRMTKVLAARAFLHRGVVRSSKNVKMIDSLRSGECIRGLLVRLYLVRHSRRSYVVVDVWLQILYLELSRRPVYSPVASTRPRVWKIVVVVVNAERLWESGLDTRLLRKSRTESLTKRMDLIACSQASYYCD